MSLQVVYSPAAATDPAVVAESCLALAAEQATEAADAAPGMNPSAQGVASSAQGVPQNLNLSTSTAKPIRRVEGAEQQGSAVQGPGDDKCSSLKRSLTAVSVPAMPPVEAVAGAPSGE